MSKLVCRHSQHAWRAHTRPSAELLLPAPSHCGPEPANADGTLGTSVETQFYLPPMTEGLKQALGEDHSALKLPGKYVRKRQFTGRIQPRPTHPRSPRGVLPGFGGRACSWPHLGRIQPVPSEMSRAPGRTRDTPRPPRRCPETPAPQSCGGVCLWSSEGRLRAPRLLLRERLKTGQLSASIVPALSIH